MRKLRRRALLTALATGAAVASLAASASAGPGAQKNTPDCHGTTSLAGGRAIDFTAYCKPPDHLALAELSLTWITASERIKSVRAAASFDGAAASCRRGARSRDGRDKIVCTTPDTGLTPPQGHTVTGRFKLKRKSDRCELVSVFTWTGGGCVGYDPQSGACADVGLGAARRFGPPSGC